MYSIGVHIFFPGTIYSPGYIEENKSKPKITLKIEESDEGLKPEQAAEVLLRGAFMPLPCHFAIVVTCSSASLGVQNGNFHIAGDLIGNLFRSSTRGATPHNNVVVDTIYSFIGWVRTVLHLIAFDV